MIMRKDSRLIGREVVISSGDERFNGKIGIIRAFRGTDKNGATVSLQVAGAVYGFFKGKNLTLKPKA